MRYPANDRSNDDNMVTDSALTTFTVASSYVKGLLAAFKINGLQVEDLLTKAQITHDQLSVPENRISLSALQLLWQGAIDASGSDVIGLDVGQAMPSGHWGLIEMLALNSETLGEAFESALLYWRLISDTGKQFHVTPTEEFVTFSFWSPFFDLPHANEADMVYFERRIKLLLGSDITPISYQFSHARHDDISDEVYGGYFSAPITFNGKVNAVTLPAEVFGRTITTSSSELKQVINEISSRQLVLLNRAMSTTQKVVALLSSGTYNLDKVASTLHMSTRTLQRRLKDEEVTFKNLVSNVKKEKAEELLKKREYSIQEISFFLGYQNERAFYDAVQRWFGTSPRGFIEQQPQRSLGVSTLSRSDVNSS